jgi:hypothetical protein
MMNLELLFWAAKNMGNPELYKIAKNNLPMAYYPMALLEKDENQF